MLLTIKEVSERLRVKPGTLYAWVARGRIPYVRIHRLVRFRAEEIERWMASFGKADEPFRGTTYRYQEHEDVDSVIARAKRAVL